MRVLTFSTLVTVSVLMLACTEKKGNDQSDISVDEISQDSIRKINEANSKQFRKAVTAEFGLQPMSELNDSLEIRIWYLYSYFPHIKLLSLHYTNEWKATEFIGEIDMDLLRSTGRDSIKIVNPIIRNLLPSSGWNNYITTMVKKNILILPESDSIDGLNDDMLDGNSYRVEISKNGVYRSYIYHSPDSFKDFTEMKNMIDILELTETELGVSWKTIFDERAQVQH